MNSLRALLSLALLFASMVAHAGYYVTDNAGKVTPCYTTLGMAVNAWQGNFVTTAATTIYAIDSSAMTVQWANPPNPVRNMTWGTCSGTPLSAGTANYTGGVVDPAFSSGGSNFTPGDLALITSLQAQNTAQQAQLNMLAEQIASGPAAESTLSPEDGVQLAWMTVSLLTVGFAVKLIKGML